MNIAIIGIINPNLTYYDWVKLFRYHFWKKRISEISITGSDTLLNSYVRFYATRFSIPISEYVFNSSSDDSETKLARNKALIENADLVVAFTTKAKTKISLVNGTKSYKMNEKDAIVIFADEPLIINQHISENKMPYQETKQKDLLTVEEECALVMQIQSGKIDADVAKEKLINSCKRFVKVIALKYLADGYSLETLISEGNKGLIHAAYKFDPMQGYKFTTFAIFWIKQSIEQYINTNL